LDITDSKILRQCLKVAELRSISQAAQALNLAQPWLSTRIRDYERRLGFDIFDRSRRRIALTPEGLLFIESARSFLNAADRFTLDMDTIRAHSRDTSLTIGCLHSSSGAPERDQLIEAFERRFPDVTVRLHLLGAEQIREGLESGRLDIAFIDSPAPVTMQSRGLLTVRPLHAVLFMPEDWGYPRCRLIGLPELRGREFAVPLAAHHPDLCIPVYQALRGYGISLREVQDESPMALQQSAMRRGSGAILVDSFADYLSKVSGYGVWRIKDDPFHSDLCLIEPLPGCRQIAREFWEFAQERFPASGQAG